MVDMGNVEKNGRPTQYMLRRWSQDQLMAGPRGKGNGVSRMIPRLFTWQLSRLLFHLLRRS